MSLSQNVFRRLLHRRRNVAVQLLTRPGCHLCDEAEVAARREFGTANVETVNILEHAELEEQYVFRIPVILFDGEPMAEGQIGRAAAHRARMAILRRQHEGRFAE